MPGPAAWSTRSRRLLALAASVLSIGIRPDLARAQDQHPNEALAFDRPESWALEYFASSTLLAGLETPRRREPWSVYFGAEVEWIPSISDGDRYVGIDGTKQEDLNKAPFYLRPRFIIGLPHEFAFTVAFDPPIRTFGIKPKLLALAIERPIVEAGAWTIGGRIAGQVGTVNGAYTCPKSVLAYPPGSVNNSYGCDGESSDTARLDDVGGEVSLAHAGLGRWPIAPHVAVEVNYMNLAFQVHAPTFGFIDTTRYTTHGVTVAGEVGFSYALGPRFGLSADYLYTPLSISRASTGTYHLPFYTVRAMLTYRIK